MRTNQITGKQMWRCLAVIIGIPSFRLFTPLITTMAGNGAPISLFISFLLFLPLLGIYAYLAKHRPGKSFAEINEELFGKWVGKFLTGLYLLWALFLAAFYLGEYAQRISGTIFYDTSMVLFILLLLFAISYALKKGIGTVARAGSILSYFVIGGILLFGLILIRDCHIENFLPLSSRDVLPTIKGLLPGLSVSVFFPLFFVFGKRTTCAKGFFRRGFLSVGVAATVALILVVIPLGVFGKEMLSKMMVPFFAVTRNVILFNSLERLEAVLVSVILMSDFIVIGILVAAVLQMMGEVFETKRTSILIDTIVIGLFMGALLTSVGDFQIDVLVERMVIPGNLVFGLLIPFLWLVFGKIRKIGKTA